MIDSAALEKARAHSIELVATQHNLRLRGKVERVGPCPRCGGTDRFSINVRKQIWNCRGCQKGGDVIAFVQFLDGCDFKQAIASLTGDPIGDGNHRPSPQHEPKAEQAPNAKDYEDRQRDKARYLWRKSQPPIGTPVEIYLRRRLNGSTKPLPPTVRYLPPLKPDHHPAMLTPYGIRKVTAVQLVLLKPDGTGKIDIKPNKITIASPAGMPIIIAPANDLLGLAITEGVEDALSVHHATGLGSWAAGGALNMPKLAAVVPSYIEVVTVFAHTDESGLRGAYELATALDKRGIETRIEGSFQCPD